MAAIAGSACNDYTFGGNFNRLKNLAVDNGGTYYVPSVTSFDMTGVAAIGDLIDYRLSSFRRQAGGACLRLDGQLHLLGRDAATRRRWPNSRAWPSSAARRIRIFRRAPPTRRGCRLVFTQGSHDSVYSADDQIAIYERLHARGYPTRFTLFNTGSHGTPVRMTDWRETLNWILTR